MVRTVFTLVLVLLSLPAMAQAPRAKPVAVGEQAPDFTLTDQNGRSHSLAAQRGKRPVVLVFYRGYW
jgi:cytochrome oxidase Cu insertion factor (SCO1/SenC/PrrC family)